MAHNLFGYHAFHGFFVSMTRRPHVHLLWIALAISPWFADPCPAARFIAFIPQSADAQAVLAVHSTVHAIAPGAQSADPQWRDYVETWNRHAANPSDPAIRRRLGLPIDAAVGVTVLDGRSLTRVLPKNLPVDWVAPQVIETPNFLLIADVPPNVAIEVAGDLENFHAVWTQMFFPLWKDRQSWDRSPATPGARPASPRMPTQTKMRVVLLRDRTQYQKALKSEGPQINQSTGYYSATLRTTFLLQASGGDRSEPSMQEAIASRYHELTHQLLAEATDTTSKALPGQRSGFWLAEGIACYMESTVIDKTFATVGGWESSRLQYARHRVLGFGDTQTLSTLQMMGRMQFQRHSDLQSLYSLAAAETHRIIDQKDGDGLKDMILMLAKMYQIRMPAGAVNNLQNAPPNGDSLTNYLRLTDQTLAPVKRDDLINLCLTRCELSPPSLRRITPQKNLVWLDLTGLKVATTDVTGLCPSPISLRQLSLEATAVDDSISTWISAAAMLEELDLSWTRAGDKAINAIPATAPLQTLWLTGAAITDAAIDPIAAWRTLRRVDLQRTQVTDLGRTRLARMRPDLTIDPLELVPAK